MEIDRTEAIDFIPINTLKGKKFVVKDYQRGYKWEQEQIEALLKDIHNHKEGKYCLQPLVIDENSDNVELIDGQQRITTIYLLLHYFGIEQFYSIDYQTRESTREFLSSNIQLLKEVAEAKTEWEDFVKQHPQFDNVDVFHLQLVYSRIYFYFEKRDKYYKDSFLNKILYQLHVIWYDIKANNKIQQPEEVFLNLNSGKVLLTSSELIKALFILDAQNKYTPDIAKLKAAELATEWDIIENKLHDDTFWYFICDHKHYETSDTRIDLIIDLANGLSPNSKLWDPMNGYRIYEELYLKGEVINWPNIKNTFNKLNEWFEDKILYHYTGFLIVSRITTLHAIITASKSKNKDEFRETLLKIIQDEFNKVITDQDKVYKKYDLEVITYEGNRRECQNALLLLNIQYYLNNKSDNKFPFNLYKSESWSVEHINPQNPREFNSVNAVVKWLHSFKLYFEKSEKEAKLRKEIDSIIKVISTGSLNRRLIDLKLSNQNKELLDNVISKITEVLELHDISNLALLDKVTNTMLSNKVFMEKRQVILDLYYMRSKAAYIPECTKDVFTKNFSKDDDAVSDSIFGLADMEDYKSHIEKQLEIYYT
jgi:uncharacterized protein with ParB-like and HNH nuclease domain